MTKQGTPQWVAWCTTCGEVVDENNIVTCNLCNREICRKCVWTPDGTEDNYCLKCVDLVITEGDAALETWEKK